MLGTFHTSAGSNYPPHERARLTSVALTGHTMEG
jgi:hypothetical protein